MVDGLHIGVMGESMLPYIPIIKEGGGKMNAFDVLKERFFLQQISHEEEIRTLLGREKISIHSVNENL